VDTAVLPREIDDVKRAGGMKYAAPLAPEDKIPIEKMHIKSAMAIGAAKFRIIIERKDCHDATAIPGIIAKRIAITRDQGN